MGGWEACTRWAEGGNLAGTCMCKAATHRGACLPAHSTPCCVHLSHACLEVITQQGGDGAGRGAAGLHREAGRGGASVWHAVQVVHELRGVRVPSAAGPCAPPPPPPPPTIGLHNSMPVKIMNERPTCAGGSSSERCVYCSTSWLVCPHAPHTSSCCICKTGTWVGGVLQGGGGGGAKQRGRCVSHGAPETTAAHAVAAPGTRAPAPPRALPRLVTVLQIDVSLTANPKLRAPGSAVSETATRVRPRRATSRASTSPCAASSRLQNSSWASWGNWEPRGR